MYSVLLTAGTDRIWTGAVRARNNWDRSTRCGMPDARPAGHPRRAHCVRVRYHFLMLRFYLQPF